MTDFLLSPGITPQLADLFVLEFPIALGVAFFLRRARGVELVVGLNVVVLALIKLVTDYVDPWDVLVAAAALGAGSCVLYELLRPPASAGLPPPVAVAIGAIAGALGLFKATHDFYDPFDLLLADLAVVTGLWLGRPLLERWIPGLRPKVPRSRGGILPSDQEPSPGSTTRTDPRRGA